MKHSESARMRDHKIAVALRYQMDRDPAPALVAKGERKMAEKILELGKDAGVPVVSDSALAQLLFPLQPGEYIPQELYEPVAKIFAYVVQFYHEEGSP